MIYKCQRDGCEVISNNNAPNTCVKCKDRYCSISCQGLAANIHKCIKKNKDEVLNMLFLLGYQKESKINLPIVAGEYVFPLPGPIKGVLPKRMIPIRESSFFRELTGNEIQILSSTDYYYFVPWKELYKVWMHELSTEQKQEIKQKMESCL